MSGTVRTVWRGGALLGEGAVWDAGRGVLWFVDIKQRRVHRFDPGPQAVTTWTAPAMIGWVFPASDGTLIAGLERGLACFDPQDGSFTPLADVPLHPQGNRLNDATVGPDGAIWFGSMDDSEQDVRGRFYRYAAGRVEATTIDPVMVANGPALSPDGGTLYHVDTVGGLIHARDVLEDGALGEARVFAEVDSADGHPDGPSVDSMGNVWIGLWGGWRARLYAPDGTILTEVRLPAANVTKVALGGPDGRTAYATTARVGLGEAALAEQPEAGNLFAFDVEVPGRPLPLARIA